jgi:tetratricopeptide (TPR) repeat protein
VAYLNQAQSLSEAEAGPYIQSAHAEFLKAEEGLLDTIEFVPWEYDNYVFLANLYNVTADTIDPAYREKAVEIARRGMEVEEYGPAIRFQLARALMELGEYEEAREHAETAARMDPDYFEIVLLLGEINLKDGDLEAAKAAYETAQGMNPSYAGLEDTLQSIEESLAAQGL